MLFNIRRVHSFTSVSVSEGSTTIDLGLLDDKQRDELASKLISAVVVMGPTRSGECDAWFKQLAADNGVEITEAQSQE